MTAYQKIVYSGNEEIESLLKIKKDHLDDRTLIEWLEKWREINSKL